MLAKLFLGAGPQKLPLENAIFLGVPSPTDRACFERVLASFARFSLYMGIAASLGIALVIEKELSSKVKDQQVERLGHGPSPDEDVTGLTADKL